MYLVTRTANLYMHGKWRNVPRSRPLGALPPVPVVHAVQCTRTHANAVRDQPVRRVVQAGELLPLRAECHAGQPPVGEAMRHLPTPAHCCSLRTARASLALEHRRSRRTHRGAWSRCGPPTCSRSARIHHRAHRGGAPPQLARGCGRGCLRSGITKQSLAKSGLIVYVNENCMSGRKARF